MPGATPPRSLAGEAAERFNESWVAGMHEPHAERFLQACTCITVLLSQLGSCFAPARRDVSGNIDRLAHLANGSSNSERLFVLLREEKARGEAKQPKSNANALLWLKRMLEFVASLLRKLLEHSDSSLRAAALDAYEQVLAQYHSWVSYSAFSVMLGVLPSRESFMSELGGASRAEVEADMQALVLAIEPVTTVIHSFLVRSQFMRSNSVMTSGPPN